MSFLYQTLFNEQAIATYNDEGWTLEARLKIILKEVKCFLGLTEVKSRILSGFSKRFLSLMEVDRFTRTLTRF